MFLVNFSCHHLEDDGTVFLWTFLSKGEYVLLWSVRPKLVYLHYLWKTSKNEEQQKRSKWRITCNHSLQEMTGFYNIWQITWISEARDGSTEGNNPPSPPPQIIDDSLQGWPCLPTILEKHNNTQFICINIEVIVFQSSVVSVTYICFWLLAKIRIGSALVVLFTSFRNFLNGRKREIL